MGIQTVELTIVIIYLVFLLGIGVYLMKRAWRSSADYWIAGKTIGSFQNSFAIMATICSGGTFLGAIGIVAALGMASWAALWLGALGGMVFASILVGKHLIMSNANTVPQFLSARYSSLAVKIIVPIFMLITLSGYLVAQLRAAGLVAQWLLGLEYTTAVWVVGIVFMLYVSLGGMHGLTFTDFVQGILMVGFFVGLALFVSFTIGNPISLMRQSIDIMPTFALGLGQAHWATLVGGFLIFFTGFSVFPHTVMRIFSAKGIREGKLAINYGMLLCAIVVICGFIISAGAIASGNVAEVFDFTLIYFMSQYLSPFLLGIIAAGVMAAVMSTADGMLLGISSTVAEDIYRGVIKPKASDRHVNITGAVTIWVIGSLVIWISMSPPAFIVQLYTIALGLVASALYFPLVLGIWWKKATDAGAIASMITGGASYGYLTLLGSMPTYSPVLIGLAFSLVFFIGVSLITSPNEAAVAEVEKIHTSLKGWS